MDDVLFISPPEPPAGADSGPGDATRAIAFLQGLLDAARAREDAPVARLVARRVDDVGAAATKRR